MIQKTLFILIIATLFSCENSRREVLNDKSFQSENGIIKDYEFGGVYEEEYFIGSFSLNLSDDNTFTYEISGCTGSSYTEGTWKQVGDTLILNSFDKYIELEKGNYISEQAESETYINENGEKVIKLQPSIRKAKSVDDIYIENVKYVMTYSGLKSLYSLQFDELNINENDEL